MAYRLKPPLGNHRNDQIVLFGDLNHYYFEPQPRERILQLPMSPDRIGSFEEVNLGFPEGATIREAERCFRCGMCSFCENCYIFCPDSAVTRRNAEEAFEINYDFCKGCGICANECRSHFIDVAPEEK